MVVLIADCIDMTDSKQYSQLHTLLSIFYELMSDFILM